ncbi:Branched-chain-amino-acid aminotransferase [Gimesia panareensis]|uniref:branched-chain-amino-acid transaminase n=1 Tax=Gimesia panareensis TaxID=2527978 RepID=A0A518FSZ8_9PLAN|nr:aminotransferase class IV [Gimesia panareensis]QDV19469.1 Branched-chain-amino-acid aminotransferase [Gimesia panareensis]
MTQNLVYLNGEYVPADEAKISIFDGAISLGMTVTESTRTFGHQPYRLRDHIDRLYLSLKAARFDAGMTPDELEKLTLEVWQKNEPNYPAGTDAWIIHNITPGQWVPSSGQKPADSHSTVMIITLPLDLSYWADFYHTGCHAVTPFTRIQPAQSLDARIKNRSRFIYTLAESEVKLVDSRAQSLLLDTDGYLSENKGGNFFLISNNRIRTPSTINCLDGISRQTIFQLGEKLNIPVEEGQLLPYDVTTADEAFFTSTPYCIMPATKFNGIDIGDGQVGPITRQLITAWSELVGVDIIAQAQASKNA